MTTKHKKMPIKKKKEILDRVLELRDAMVKIDDSMQRLRIRRQKLVAETSRLSQTMYEELEYTLTADHPIVYGGKVFTFGWTDVEISHMSKL